jgi:mono/diheme cytochrome c family protein
MKRKWMLYVLLIAAYACASRKKAPPELVITDPQAKQGQQLFGKHCQKCHPDGKKGSGPALYPNPPSQFVAGFDLRHSLGVMPYFGKGEMTRDSLDAIMAYLQVLKSRKG